VTTTNPLPALRAAAERELLTDILPYWATVAVDRDQSGFFGAISADGRPDPSAGKGGVLNARILWAFSAALRRRPDPLYREMADRAFAYMWTASGIPSIRACSGRSTKGRNAAGSEADLRPGIRHLRHGRILPGDRQRAALDRAIRLFEDIETKALDPVSGGYWEARGREWQPIDDIRLSAIDMNAPFSMNTHLHLLEAYTTLALACDDPRPRVRLRALLEMMLDRFIGPSETGHLTLFFDEGWQSLSNVISYGHDIETSWLICEAADVIGDPGLVARARTVAVKMADAVLAGGFDTELGGVYWDSTPGGHVDTRKDWWPQAEAVVGFLNAYQISGRAEHLEAAMKTWAFIDAFVIDHVAGEWHTRVSREGVPVPDLPKADFWKCPYHDARAMLEVMARIDHLEQAASR
jgi:mannobiose 2-epimerase